MYRFVVLLYQTMKNLFKLVFVFCFISQNLFSQSGTVVYAVQIDVSGVDVPKNNSDFIAEMITKAKNQQYELMFNKSQSSFKLVDDLSEHSDSENKMAGIARAAFGSSRDIYIDYNSKVEIEQEDNGILIENKFDTSNWELTTESKKIANYLCYKAIKRIPFTDRNGLPKVNEIVAWFAPSLPYGYGPKSFYGLPGLILELTRIRTTFLATKIVIEDKKELKIKFPVGKTTTKAAYDKQLKAQMGM